MNYLSTDATQVLHFVVYVTMVTDDFSREDLASALLWTLSTDLALALYFACQANNIRDVYFAGSMTGHSQLVREYLEKAFILTQHNSGQVAGIYICSFIRSSIPSFVLFQ